MVLLIQGEETKYSDTSRKITETKEPATHKFLKNYKPPPPQQQKAMTYME